MRRPAGAREELICRFNRSAASAGVIWEKMMCEYVFQPLAGRRFVLCCNRRALFANSRAAGPGRRCEICSVWNYLCKSPIVTWSLPRRSRPASARRRPSSTNSSPGSPAAAWSSRRRTGITSGAILFHVRIDLGVPGTELVVSHEPSPRATLSHDAEGELKKHIEIHPEHKDATARAGGPRAGGSGSGCNSASLGLASAT